jgi:hypothetical protein
MKYKQKLKRYEKIIALRSEKWSYGKISRRFHISGERVRQIIAYGKPEPHIVLKKETKERVDRRIVVNRKTGKKMTFNAHAEKYGFQGRDYVRERVRVRDGHTCQSCGVFRHPSMRLGKRSLDVHHLDGLCGKKSIRYDRVSEIDRLVTLCHKCHFNHPQHTINRAGYKDNRIPKQEYPALIKSLIDGVQRKDLAKKYGVSKSAISMFAKRHLRVLV